jgi:spermidine/putrescine transport system ATP-binding protein
MNKGRIDQIASPAELYDRPATKFVAGFIGTMNLLPARFVGTSDGRMRFEADGLNVSTPAEGQLPAPGAMLTVGIRPEDLIAVPEASPETTEARIVSVVFHGKTLRMHAEIGKGTRIVIDMPRQGEIATVAAGTILNIALRQGATCPVLRA